MKKCRKAALPEKKAYKGVYPLYGFVTVEGHTCPIEDLRADGSFGEANDPERARFEIMLPLGFVRKGYDETTIYCRSVEDVNKQARYADLEAKVVA